MHLLSLRNKAWNAIEVLNSQTAIKVNIQIIRVFTKMREMLTDSFNLKVEIEDIKRKISSQDENIGLVLVI